MRLARVATQTGPAWVRIEGDAAIPVAIDAPSRDLGPAIGSIGGFRLLAPIEPHNKVIGLLDNFDGKKDRKGPGLFLKPNTAIIATGDPIIWPEQLAAINFEAELAVVIGRTARNVPMADALDHVLGYTISNDVTSFPALMEDGPASLSTRFKLYDSFLPLGPWIETDAEPGNLALSSSLNGEVRQQANTGDMAFSVAETVCWISQVMTLNPGDVISMGTPPGFVPMARGDVVQCRIGGIGILENRVA